MFCFTYRKSKKLHISEKKIFQNDLDDTGSMSYFRLVSTNSKLLFEFYTYHVWIQIIVSICNKMGHHLNNNRYSFYPLQINGNAHINYRLWWIYNIACWSDTWNWIELIYNISTIIRRWKNTVCKFIIFNF